MRSLRHTSFLPSPPNLRMRLLAYRVLTLLLLSALWTQSPLWAQETAIPVTTQPAANVVFFPEHNAAANVVARNETLLSAEIQGQVAWIGPAVGATVDQAEVLLRLDCRDPTSAIAVQQANLEGVLARLRFSQAQLRRAEELQGRTHISEEEMDRRRMEQASLQAESQALRESLAQARWHAERCEIRAPFNAALQQRLVGVGALATPGQPLLRLIQLDDLEVSAALPPQWTAEASSTPSPRFIWLEQEYPLRWQRQAAWLEGGTRLRELRYAFVEDSPLPPPGAAGRLHWSSAQPHLPADLLLRRGQQLGVFIRDGDQARFIPLPDAQEGQPAPATPVLETEIILAGRHSLYDSAAIQVQEADTTP